jgi:hypothetical protein
MEIRVWQLRCRRGARHPGLGFGYNRVYETDGERTLVYPTVKKSLNSFLNTWLSNIIEQGHTLVEQDAPLTGRPFFSGTFPAWSAWALFSPVAF